MSFWSQHRMFRDAHRRARATAIHPRCGHPCSCIRGYRCLGQWQWSVWIRWLPFRHISTFSTVEGQLLKLERGGSRFEESPSKCFSPHRTIHRMSDLIQKLQRVIALTARMGSWRIAGRKTAGRNGYPCRRNLRIWFEEDINISRGSYQDRIFVHHVWRQNPDLG